jgi:site-specific recombinase XerD
LAAKRVGRRRDDPGNADRARRGDLRRWAAAINSVQGRPTPPDLGPSLTGWDSVMTEIADVEVLVRALDLLGDELASSSRQRALSTLRGFYGYLVRRGLLAANPCDAPELSVRADTGIVVAAFTSGDVDQLVAAASAPPPSNVRSAWPTRDVAIVDVLAHSGPRVSELAGLTIADVDRRGEHPLLRITTGAKGGKHRTVPLPRATVNHVDAYLAERAATGDDRLKAAPRAPLFVRHNGAPLNQQFVDSLLRRLAATAGITAPEGAMAHALRHSYGMELALRGVPLPVIQQLLGHSDPRTTSIYTAAHASDLTATLHDAGLL